MSTEPVLSKDVVKNVKGRAQITMELCRITVLTETGSKA